jgi:hypothetical protein
MTAREVFALLPLVAQLIQLFGGKKAKKKARVIYPLIGEAITLWPDVRTALEQLAEQDMNVKRFRTIIDQVVGEV